MDLTRIIYKLRSEDMDERQTSTQDLHATITHRDEARVAEAVKAGLIPALVGAIHEGLHDTFWAARSMFHIARDGGQGRWVSQMCVSGVVPALKEIIEGHDSRNQSEAFMSLSQMVFRLSQAKLIDHVLEIVNEPGLLQHAIRVFTEARANPLPVENALSMIGNVSAILPHPEIKKALLDACVLEAIAAFTTGADKLGLLAMRTLARITGGDELRKGHASAIIHLGPTKLLVSVQNKLISGEKLIFGSNWTPASMVQPMFLMCISDTNKPLLIEAGAVPVLVKSIRHGTDERAVGFAVCALFELSFVHDSDSELIASGLMPEDLLPLLLQVVSKELHSTIDEDAYRSAMRLAARLQNTVQEEQPPASAATTRGRYRHVMLSYCRESKSKVVALAKALRSHGVITWRDEEGSPLVPACEAKDTDDIMTAALDMADTVLICVSKGYKQSANCRFEANHAMQLCEQGKLKMIFVMVDSNYTPVSNQDQVDGWLGRMLGDNRWYPAWTVATMNNTCGSIARLVAPVALAEGTAKVVGKKEETGAVVSTNAAVSKMTSDDVSVWLHQHNLSELVQVFAQMGIEGKSLLDLQQLAKQDSALLVTQFEVDMPEVSSEVRARLEVQLLEQIHFELE